ncbi:MAG TPA: hypothetical protein VI612_03700 [Candidatus Nanoarchaeia archaeon]|nr:hypothetical protein [Candidatus Nanoarchaeia archaeon]
MNLLFLEEDLEALVEAEQKTAVEELEAEEDEPEKTVDEIVKELSDEFSEETSAVVEQQQDPESFLSTAYTIGVEYGGETKKSYYESLKDAVSTETGAVYEAVIEQEGKSLELGQEINEYAREDKMSNRTTFVLDPASRDARDQIKLFNPALWQIMYDGKIKFN